MQRDVDFRSNQESLRINRDIADSKRSVGNKIYTAISGTTTLIDIHSGKAILFHCEMIQKRNGMNK